MAKSTIVNLNRSNSLGPYTDISSYSVSNLFTVPVDGYVWYSLPFNASVQVKGSAGGDIYMWFQNSISSTQAIQGAVFVREGMTVGTNSGSPTVRFFPLQ